MPPACRSARHSIGSTGNGRRKRRGACSGDNISASSEMLLDARAEQGGRWLDWVAGQLYLLRPPEYAAMVRRELQRLSGD